MLYVFRETKDSFSLVHDDCTVDSSTVQSIVLEFDKNSKFELNEYSAVKAQDFVDCNKKVYWTISDELLKKSNLYDVEYQIVKIPTKIITSIEEGNILHGIGILYDFHDTDFIKIDDKVYEIDKKHSNIDYLFLKKPVCSEILSYNPVLIFKECILLRWELKKTIHDKIASISSCDVCTSEVNDLMCDIFKLMRVQTAIDCGNCDDAKIIFNSLKNKYRGELC